MNLSEIKSRILSGEADGRLTELYGEEKLQGEKRRYIKAIDSFKEYFGYDQGDVAVFSAPGRTELCGNHTDHNFGKVLAGAVNIDVIAVVCKTDSDRVRIKSEGHAPNEIKLSELSPVESEKGSSNSILRGMVSRIKDLGYEVGSFDAYTTSEVPAGSGLSSSAAFEALIGHIMDCLWCGSKIDNVLLAKVAQYAENEFFGKPCGLMDQLTITTGSAVKFDFEDIENPKIEKLDYDFMSSGYKLCIVNTGGSHADLTDDYASIRSEMESVAHYFSKNVLRKVDKQDVLNNISEIRKSTGDRAVLRAMHFYGENERVDSAAEYLKNDDFKGFLSCIKDSGKSSFMFNQNVFSTTNPAEQGIALALCCAEQILGESGVYRVHGGGFAGTIQAFVPEDKVELFKDSMESVFGENCCYIVCIRPCGPVKVI